LELIGNLLLTFSIILIYFYPTTIFRRVSKMSTSV
jgi:hypothetical protein